MVKVIRAEHSRESESEISRPRLDDNCYDVTVHVGEKEFKCHRKVLAKYSEYFEVMFDGNFRESFDTEVTLVNTKADVFEELLNHMYVGKAVMDRSNFCDIVCAADFYRIPGLVNECVKFLKRNLNELDGDILKMYCARNMEITPIAKLLGSHIYRNFAHFSKTADFAKLPFDSLLGILELVSEQQVVPLQDPFLEGIFRWLALQVDLTAEERKEYTEILIRQIDFTKLSFKYPANHGSEILRKDEDISTRRELVVQNSVGETRTSETSITPTHLHETGSLFAETVANNEFQRSSTGLLRAYVSRISKNERMGQYGTSIFTGFSNASRCKWLYSGEVYEVTDTSSPRFLSNVVVDDRLYSLRYYNSGLDYDVPRLTFSSSCSISMYPFLSLSQPPYIREDFDICAAGKEIYLYYKSDPYNRLRPNGNRKLSPDECKGGLCFLYKPHIDKWIKLPDPILRSRNACITCDEERMYLIGGAGSDRFVQAYDPRLDKWSSLPRMRNYYDGAACCAYDAKIYAVGHPCYPYCGETYDPISGNSTSFYHRSLAPYKRPITNYVAGYLLHDPSETKMHNHPGFANSSNFCNPEKHELVNWPDRFSGANRIVNYPETLTYGTVISCFDTSLDDGWFMLPDLYEAVNDTQLSYDYHLRILNMITF